jgi:hypothetical protein
MSKNKFAIAISVFLMFAMAASIATVPVTNAHDPPLELKTFAFVNAAPSPVGVGQIVYINGFLSNPPPTASMGGSGDVYEDITIEITYPDETKDTWGPYYSDPTGGIWTSFTPSEVGTYTFQLFYPGQVLTGSNSHYGPGAVPRAPDYWDDIMLPSSSEIMELVVQEEPIDEVSIQPLPTEYWSRPIYSTNYAWAELGANWYGLSAGSFMTTGGYDAYGNVQPDGTAPDTAHILWNKPTGFGGQVGAGFPSDQESQYESTSIGKQHFNSIIINGVLFYVEYPGLGFGNQTKWVAVDLHTGETLWTRDRGETGGENLRMGQVIKFHTIQEFGSYATLWTYSGGTYRIYDAFTGEGPIARITDAASASFVMDFDCNEAGTILGYYTSGDNLIMWNSTRCLFYGSGGFDGVNTAIFVSYSGDRPWANGIEWNVSRNFDINGIPTGNLGVGAVTSEAILLRSAPTLSRGGSVGYQITACIDAKTGSLLWGPLNQTIPQDENIALIGADEGYYVLYCKDTGEVYGYSLTTGKMVWGPVEIPRNAWSALAAEGEIAYGQVYIFDLGGYVNALDLETGEIKWTFTPRSSGYETPYGIYPLWVQGSSSIADGKLFLCEGTSYNPPLFPGAQRLAINCTTGEIVWSISSFSVRTIGAIAESMLVDWDGYDKQIYVFGKGQTATTVTIQDDVVTHGDTVMVKGRVMDESPGTKNSDRVARFPDGVPAIADADMSAWMEYVYKQQSKPTNTTGVDVTISVLDPNGNCYDVGTVTTSDGFYKLAFTPPVPGEYTVYATFTGTESYYGSSTMTAITVEEAPIATAEPTPQPASMADMYILPGIIGIIVAIAVVGIIIILMLRKR